MAAAFHPCSRARAMAEADILVGLHAGKCAKEIEKYCDDVDEGEGKLADCISDSIASTEMPENSDGESRRLVHATHRPAHPAPECMHLDACAAAVRVCARACRRPRDL